MISLRDAGRRSSKTCLIVLLTLSACIADSRPASRTPARPTRTPDAFASIEARATPSPARPVAAPRWEEVAVLTGSGPAARPLTISPEAIQWRADWSCENGTLRLESIPAPRNGRPLAEGSCPEEGMAYSVKTGRVRLQVNNPGAWRVVVSQQVTTPVEEPPLPQMTAPAARALAKGDFFAVERKGKGQAVLFRLPDGALAVRLQDFETSANTDLFVWASEAPRPATSEEALQAPHVVLSELRSTVGSQNYMVPKELPPGRIRSIVIWCQPVQIAYVAAALRPSP